MCDGYSPHKTTQEQPRIHVSHIAVQRMDSCIVAINGMGTVARSRAAEHLLTHTANLHRSREPRSCRHLSPSKRGAQGAVVCVYGTVRYSAVQWASKSGSFLHLHIRRIRWIRRRRQAPTGDRTLNSEPHAIHVAQQ